MLPLIIYPLADFLLPLPSVLHLPRSLTLQSQSPQFPSLLFRGVTDGWNGEYKQSNKACCEAAMGSMGVLRRQGT